MDIYLVRDYEEAQKALGFLDGTATVFSSEDNREPAKNLANSLSLDAQVLGALSRHHSVFPSHCFRRFMDVAEYLCGERPAVVLMNDIPKPWLESFGILSEYNAKVLHLEYDGDLSYVNSF